MAKPQISVIMPSYNHAPFIKKAIDSVLMQDFKDYEFLIADDCSPDNSREIINGFKDQRIKKFFFEENKGAVDTLNFLIEEAQGEYIALINSDDYWKQGKLKRQYDYMKENSKVGACFTWADIVDENGILMDKQKIWYADVFNEVNRTQGQWLKHYFVTGNCMCHPSMLIRKKVYDEVGLYNPILRQLPDFQMWINVVKHYPIHMIEESLTCHRRTFNEVQNTSAETPENAIRNINELTYIFEHFFDDMSDEVFIDGFKEFFLLKLDTWSPQHLACEKAFIIRKGNYANASCQVIAINKLGQLLMDPDIRQILKRDYAFKYKHYYDMTGTMGIGAFTIPNSNSIPNQEEREIPLFKKLLTKIKKL